MGTVSILLTQGKYALIDEEDLPLISQFNWRARNIDGRWYAVAYSPEMWRLYRRHDVFMHRLIMNADPGTNIDHRDGNGLNNQRSNVRRATHTEKMHNGSSHRDSTSRYKGVSWHTQRQRWVAQLCVNGHRLFLGHFVVEEEAARAYDQAAREHHGEFARLNFPGG